MHGIAVADEALEGAFAAADIVDPETGEVILEANEELTPRVVSMAQTPKIVMAHNFVLLKAGSDVNAFSVAAMTARATEFIPESLKDQVIARTALLGPRKSDEITFKLTAAGVYPFLCSFPAHAGAGMKGTITVN